MSLALHVETAVSGGEVPDPADMQRWAEAALGEHLGIPEVSVRVVDEAEIAELNQRYRNKAGPTNVLSFPFEDPPGVDSQVLGDIILCAPVVAREALQQGKAEQAHWAHLLVHGMLHLRGFDHMMAHDADVMEREETRILNGLGFPAPYQAA